MNFLRIICHSFLVCLVGYVMVTAGEIKIELNGEINSSNPAAGEYLTITTSNNGFTVSLKLGGSIYFHDFLFSDQKADYIYSAINTFMAASSKLAGGDPVQTYNSNSLTLVLIHNGLDIENVKLVYRPKGIGYP